MTKESRSIKHIIVGIETEIEGCMLGSNHDE